MKKLKDFVLENKNNEKNAENKFRYTLRTMHPDGVHIYHETPGHVANSIKQKGLIDSQDSPNTIYGTIGQTSGFVNTPKKTITHFVIPHSLSHRLIHHDMRYDGYNHLMSEHPNAKGADISINASKIPISWIKSIKEVGGEVGGSNPSESTKL